MLVSAVTQWPSLIFSERTDVFFEDSNMPNEVLSDMDRMLIRQLDERAKRLFLATRASHLGKHGVTLVSKASGMNRKTIYRGIRELKEADRLQNGRVRKIGGGRKKLLQKHPEYTEEFDAIAKDHTAGLPQDLSVRWVNLTIPQIREELEIREIEVSDYHVRQMVKMRGFKKRSFVKSKTFKDVKDRDAQFRKIGRIVSRCLDQKVPVLSIDTKKKEMTGNFKRSGLVLCDGVPKALDHDFQTYSTCTIVPHGIYDIGANTGYMTIGTSHDTAEFVCDNILRVWTEHLQWQYPKAENICLLCDGGGSNSSSHNVFKQSLMKLSKNLELGIMVVHYPPYCSKYNPIEHRLFPHVTRSWSGVPLLSVEQACLQASRTKTNKGLRVYAAINNKFYETKKPVESTFETDKSKYIIFDDSLPKWNYLVKVA